MPLLYRSPLRKLFRWRDANWWIGVLLSGSLLGLVFADKFGLAYFILVVVWLGSVLSWLVSDFLERKRVKRSYQTKTKNSPSGNTVSAYRRWQIGGSVLISLLFTVVFLWIRGIRLERELTALQGELYPDNKSVDIPARCQPKHPSDLVVMSGGNIFVANYFPHTVLRIGCDKTIVVERGASDTIALNLTIYDKDRKIVVDIKHGHFEVNRNNYFKIDRQGSRSTLAVTDQFNQEILYMHLLNKNVLELRAIIHDPRFPEPIRLFDSPIQGTLIHNNCSQSRREDVRFGECLFDQSGRSEPFK